MTPGGLPNEVTVHLDAPELGPAVTIGSLRRAGSPGRSAISFTYANSWLQRPDSFSVDPSLQLVGGAQYVADGGLPGAFGGQGRRAAGRRAAVTSTARRDDHLRDHGFLHTSQGWRLAPAFDMNPAPEKADHVLAIDDRLHIPDLALVRESRVFYRLSNARAADVIDEVLTAATDWRLVAARDAGLRSDELDLWVADSWFEDLGIGPRPSVRGPHLRPLVS